MRYACLVLDHDDTVTDSTAHVHHPAFLAALEAMRPGRTVTLEEYFQLNFDPGFLEYCEGELHMTEAELEREYRIWQSFVSARIPRVFPGMDRLIREQKRRGGYVCVVSHSVDENIRRDYRENGLPEPDQVYGWELPREHRKPAVYALNRIAETLCLRPSDLLVVDDLKPGFEMARAAGVDFAAALWAHSVPGIRAFMQEHARFCLETPEDLYALQFGGQEGER